MKIPTMKVPTKEEIHDRIKNAAKLMSFDIGDMQSQVQEGLLMFFATNHLHAIGVVKQESGRLKFVVFQYDMDMDWHPEDEFTNVEDAVFKVYTESLYDEFRHMLRKDPVYNGVEKWEDKWKEHENTMVDCPFCNGSKFAPFLGGNQDCDSCDKNGQVTIEKLKSLDLI